MFVSCSLQLSDPSEQVSCACVGVLTKCLQMVGCIEPGVSVLHHTCRAPFPPRQLSLRTIIRFFSNKKTNTHIYLNVTLPLPQYTDLSSFYAACAPYPPFDKFEYATTTTTTANKQITTFRCLFHYGERCNCCLFGRCGLFVSFLHKVEYAIVS